ncbi:MAG: NUMOD3 domain-containing DNA-binding protein [Nitrospirae bacterium]|nr:NUMOD3 domain-containing DNA-binding protein [Nitrospirota bacterium]
MPTIVVKCSFCGKEKKVKPSDLRIHKNFFCNQKCKSESQKGRRWHHTKESIQKMRLAQKGHPGYTTGMKFIFTEERKQNISLALIGRSLSEEHKNKISEGLKNQSIENRLKRSNTLKEQYTTGGRVPYWLGKTFSEKHKQKMKETWNKPKLREFAKIRRLNQILPTRDTSIEVLMQNELRNRNIPFQTHFPVLGQPDIAIQNGHNFAIFCDGCYWHGCPFCFSKFSEWIEKRKISDAQVTRYLQSRGWVVLRFWEHDIKNNLQDCINKIEEAIN